MNKLYRNYKLKVAFSKAAPQDACPSAGRLLHCALLPIRAKCGLEAADFVREYVTRFTAAVDPKCVLDNKSNKTSAAAISPSSTSSQGGAVRAARRRLTFCLKVRRRGTFHSSISISVTRLKKQPQKNSQKCSAFFCRNSLFRAGNSFKKTESRIIWRGETGRKKRNRQKRNPDRVYFLSNKIFKFMFSSFYLFKSGVGTFISLCRWK